MTKPQERQPTAEIPVRERRVTFMVSDEEQKRLRELAAAQDRSVSAMLRRLADRAWEEMQGERPVG